MMRPKVFYGTNSITCANSVLPTFMPSSGSVKPESIAKPYRPFQIVDTPESSETILNTVLVGTQQPTNRTVVLQDTYSQPDQIRIAVGTDSAPDVDPQLYLTQLLVNLPTTATAELPT
jgi:hypothetical protein